MTRRKSHRRPARSHDTTLDGGVLSQLYRLGADISKPRPTNFYLYFPSQSNAQCAGSELTDLGFSVFVDKSLGDHPWLCLASKGMAAEATTLASLRKTLTDLAERLDGEYDGWEVEVIPENSNGPLNQLFGGNNHG